MTQQVRAIASDKSIYVVIYNDLQAKVNVDYEAEQGTIQQPKRYGGTIKFPLSEYNDFEGDMRDFILEKRRSRRD